MDDLLDVGEHRATGGHGGDNGGEVVIGEDHVRGLFGDVRARDAHGHTDIGSFEGRRIVHTVTGHSHHVAMFLVGIDDAQLVFGRDSGIHRDLLGNALKLIVAHGFQFASCEHSVVWLPYPYFLGYGHGRVFVITRDHHGTNAGRETLANGLFHFIAGRILQSHQTDKSQAPFHTLRIHLLGR